MVSVVHGLGSRKFATKVVYLSLASLGLVAANARLHASRTFYVRNPNLVRPDLEKARGAAASPGGGGGLDLEKRAARRGGASRGGGGGGRPALEKARGTAARPGGGGGGAPDLEKRAARRRVKGGGGGGCDTRLLQWYLWSPGLVAANSRLRLCTCPLRLWAW